jgi:hypothetical protein
MSASAGTITMATLTSPMDAKVVVRALPFSKGHIAKFPTSAIDLELNYM